MTDATTDPSDAAPLLVEPAASPRSSSRLRRSWLVWTLALLLLGAVGVTLFSFVTTEARLEHYYRAYTKGSQSDDELTTTSSQREDYSNFEYDHPPRDYDPLDADDGDLASDYECIGWRRTGGGSPDGPREPQFDADCSTLVRGGPTGYCLFRHKTKSMVVRRALVMQSHALTERAQFRCDQTPLLQGYGKRGLAYIHDPQFAFDKNREALRTENRHHTEEAITTSTTTRMAAMATSSSFFERGVVMVVYEKLLVSAYASIRSMRAMGMALPIEMWYRRDETDVSHPLLQLLAAKYGVYVREIQDPLATSYYTKLHAVFYSAFDHVLLLDADNFAVTDPTYLFETVAFREKGALFWPDYWSPRFTIFNLHANSLAWQVFDLPFVDMFEQESGQVLIDRRRHQKALNVLMYYGFSLPRVHEQLQLVWGDKDLFRLAWLKTNSTFHFITRPPGAAGKLHETNETRQFCGATMVQYDPLDAIVFLHRNVEKLNDHNQRIVWTHVQQFNTTPPRGDYWVHYAGGIVDDLPTCYGKPDNWAPAFYVDAITTFPFHDLEYKLLSYAAEATALVKVK